MRASLLALEMKCHDLRNYLLWLRRSAELSGMRAGIAPSLQEMVIREIGELGKSPSKRAMEYSAVIVTLYGAVEQFIEGVVRGYARHLNRCYAKYTEMPPPIASHHLEQTTKVLERVEENRYKGLTSSQELVANLHSCLSNTTPYTVNDLAFCHHTSNFRCQLVEDLFRRLNIGGILSKAKSATALENYFAENFQSVNVANLTNEQAFAWLDDLAERRNEVAHGSVSQILSLEILEDYIGFAEAFCKGIFEVVNSIALGVIAAQRGRDLGKPLCVFDHRIVCITLRSTAVQVGDLLIGQSMNASCPYVGGEILEIQVDRVPCERVAAWPNINVGLRVDFRALRGRDYFLVRS